MTTLLLPTTGSPDFRLRPIIHDRPQAATAADGPGRPRRRRPAPRPRIADDRNPFRVQGVLQDQGPVRTAHPGSRGHHRRLSAPRGRVVLAHFAAVPDPGAGWCSRSDRRSGRGFPSRTPAGSGIKSSMPRTGLPKRWFPDGPSAPRSAGRKHRRHGRGRNPSRPTRFSKDRGTLPNRRASALMSRRTAGAPFRSPGPAAIPRVSPHAQAAERSSRVRPEPGHVDRSEGFRAESRTLLG